MSDKALAIFCMNCSGLIFAASSTQAVMDSREEIGELEDEGNKIEYYSIEAVRQMTYCNCEEPPNA